MAHFTLITGPADGEPVPDGDGLTVLLRRLEIARLEAGRPTYRVIGHKAKLSASTICRIFNAKKPPPWDNVERVLEALGVTPDARWRELWRNAEDSANPIAVDLVDGLDAPGRRNCPTCGSWIADNNTHNEHHRRTEALAERIEELNEQLAQLTARNSPWPGSVRICRSSRSCSHDRPS
jgi:Helix-turn-helix domain